MEWVYGVTIGSKSRADPFQQEADDETSIAVLGIIPD
jgi:hypothetical protein